MWGGVFVCVCVRVYIYRGIIYGVEFWFVCVCVCTYIEGLYMGWSFGLCTYVYIYIHIYVYIYIDRLCTYVYIYIDRLCTCVYIYIDR